MVKYLIGGKSQESQTFKAKLVIGGNGIKFAQHIIIRCREKFFCKKTFAFVCESLKILQIFYFSNEPYY